MLPLPRCCIRKIRNVMFAARKKLLFFLLGVLLLCSILAGLCIGSVPLSPGTLFSALRGDPTQQTARTILLQLRLPRVLAALFAGAGLAVAGALLQGATGNDLCSPNVMGVNAGAGFFVMLCLCVFPMAFTLLPLAAFCGALGTTLLVIGMSFCIEHRSVKTTVVLAGVAISALFNAGISFLSQLFPDMLLSYAVFSAGGFSNTTFSDLLVPVPIIILSLILAQALSPQLNLLGLGDELAASLGVRVRRVRFFALVLASALCACVVCFAGLLGFVGLIVPHASRRLCGHDMRTLIGVCALLGASLVIVSDLAARSVFAPAVLPAGILLAALGAPFFLYLLLKRRNTL